MKALCEYNKKKIIGNYLEIKINNKSLTMIANNFIEIIISNHC